MDIDQRMYKYVMRNSERNLEDKDEIIEYLVRQCYYIELYIDELQEKLDKIKDIVNPKQFIIKDDDLPF